MATIEDVINFSQDQVNNALADSQAFVDELREAISWESTWNRGDIELQGVGVLSDAADIDIEPDSSTRPAKIVIPARNDPGYSSELLTQARNLLLSDIRDGGYGLDPRDETALWERAKDRESINAAAGIAEFQRAMAARGFSIPPGAMIAGTMKLQQDARAKNSSINREIALKRADLYVQNRQFAITTGLNTEQFLANWYAGFAEREISYIRLLIEANGFDLRVWEADRGDRFKEAEFRLDRWAKNTQAYLDAARLQIAELQGISDNDHKITTEGIAAASKAIDLYREIAVAASQVQSAITTLVS